MRRNLVRVTVACLLTCLAVAVSFAAPVRFVISPDTLRADADGMWHAGLSIENGGATGVYADSLFLEQWSLDPDSSTAPRHSVRSLEGLVRILAPAGAGESSGFDWTAPAEFTHGDLRFRLHAHDAHKQPLVLEATVHVAGSEFDEANPTRIVGTPGTEVIVIPADSALRPAPAIVVAFEPGVAARSQARWARTLRQRGFTVVLTSAPGWGRSKGVSDRCGAADVAAVDAGILTALKEPGVDPKRVVLWGHGHGGTSALLAAIKRPELAGVVAIDAPLDPTTEYQTLKGEAREAFMKSNGAHAAGWKDRSPVAQASRVAPPVLVVQTDEAAVADPVPAAEFAARRSDAKLFVESRIHGRDPNPVRRRDAQRLALDFAARRTGKPGK